MKNITKEQENFLNKCTDVTWKLNTETGLVDILGDFNCSSMGLSDFMGIEFGNISGIFMCSFNRLVSLKGAPKKVRKSFYCYNNQLVSLEGAPQEVGGNFYCYRNPLVSLKVSNLQIRDYLFCDPVALKGCSPDLLRKIHFYTNMSDNYIRLINDIEGIINDLEPEIYLKKMI